MNKPIAGQSSGMPDNAAQPTEMQSTEVLAGSIERVTFHNPANGFCVLRIKARGQRDLVTVVGHAAEISAGEWVTVSGTWVNSREHGQQFKAAFLRSSPPTTAERSTGRGRHYPLLAIAHEPVATLAWGEALNRYPIRVGLWPSAPGG